jgi:hypothetical protein
MTLLSVIDICRLYGARPGRLAKALKHGVLQSQKVRIGKVRWGYGVEPDAARAFCATQRASYRPANKAPSPETLARLDRALLNFLSGATQPSLRGRVVRGVEKALLREYGRGRM